MKKFKEAIAESLNGEIDKKLLPLLPSGFQTIGDVAVLNLKKELLAHSGIIGRCMLSLYPSIRTVCVKIDAVKGAERLPTLEKVAGGGTETVHSENGCLYKLDVAKVMFSKGNTKERGRLASVVNKEEVVVDMFAGIGYFTVPIAKAKVKKVYAIELNPNSVDYLVENIKLNKLHNVETIAGDNRNAPARLEGVADRVLMGYFPGTEKFLDKAFFFLKPQGGIIHFHEVYKDKDLWKLPIGILKAAGESHGMKLKVLDKHVVKAYSPRTSHVVIDSEFRPSGVTDKTNE